MAGVISLWATREKVGKTTCVAEAVSRFTRGEPFGGLTAQEGGLVLWISEESPAVVRARFQRQRADLDAIVHSGISDLADAARVLNLGNRAETAAALITHLAPAIVVIDTLDPFRSGIVTKASQADGWDSVFAPLQRSVRDTGSACLILHHARKGGEGGYRDSTAVGAAVDVIIEPATKATGDRSNAYVARGKSLYAMEDFRVFDYNSDDESVRVEALDVTIEERLRRAASDAGEQLRQDVLGYLKHNPKSSTRKIRDAVPGRAARVQQALAGLEADGLVASESGRRRAVLWRVCAVEDSNLNDKAHARASR